MILFYLRYIWRIWTFGYHEISKSLLSSGIAAKTLFNAINSNQSSFSFIVRLILNALVIRWFFFNIF